MADIVIRLLATRSGEGVEYVGKYVQEYDPDGDEGNIFLVCTDKPDKARRFPGKAEAREYYRQQSKREPLREDGEPNRPLTAFAACFGTITQCSTLG